MRRFNQWRMRIAIRVLRDKQERTFTGLIESQDLMFLFSR